MNTFDWVICVTAFGVVAFYVMMALLAKSMSDEE